MPFLADQVLGRHFEIVEEHLGGVVVDHRLDRPDLDTLAEALAHVDQNTDSPSVRFFTSSTGVVRASSSIRSECSAREVHTFWPLTT